MSFTEGGEILVLMAVLLSAMICANARAIGERLNVMAKPDGQRRLHSQSTPQVGGIAIILPVCGWLTLTLLVPGGVHSRLPLMFLICMFGVGLVGFADDQRDTSPESRMLSIIVFLAVAFVLYPPLTVSHLNWGSFAPTPISPWLYYILMAATAVGLVNAVNMADGQNGVVGGMFVIWTACLFLITHGSAAHVALVMMLTSLVFLGFNLAGRLFLGDAGTYGVTFTLGLLVALAHARGEMSLETIIVWFFIPVADCLRLLISRPARGASPFEGDRDHFHHRLEDRFGKQVGLAIYTGTVAVTSSISALMPRFALVCLAVLTAIYFSFAWLTDSSSVAKSGQKDLNNEMGEGDAQVIDIEEGKVRRTGA